MSLQVSMGILAVAILLTIFELLRRRVLREKYAAIWIVTGLLVLAGAIAPGAVQTVASALGFKYASNFVFVIAGLGLLFTLMQMSLELGRVEARVQLLAEEIALLKERLTRP